VTSGAVATPREETLVGEPSLRTTRSPRIAQLSSSSPERPSGLFASQVELLVLKSPKTKVSGVDGRKLGPKHWSQPSTARIGGTKTFRMATGLTSRVS